MLQNKLKIYCTVVKYDFQKDKKRAFIIWVTEGGRVSVILKTVKKKITVSKEYICLLLHQSYIQQKNILPVLIIVQNTYATQWTLTKKSKNTT